MRNLVAALIFIFTVAVPAAAVSPAPKKEKTMKTYSKPSDAELRKNLTPLQYSVTQKEDTERPFNNTYWDNHEAGIYVDVVSGEPLFSSIDKFESGTGWPSFVRPLKTENIVEKVDRRLFGTRTEVRSKHGDSHLGHVFPDGPKPTGLRYCMNSASMRFIPVAKLEAEGYAEFLPLFVKKAPAKTETVDLAGGCFWGMQHILRKIPGVVHTEVGYAGGAVANATYENHEGHAEAVQVVFDPETITFEQLLRWYFRMHDPTTLNSQGNDRGTSYRSAIFYRTDAQRKTAEAFIKRVGERGKWGKPIVTQIEKAGKFWKAEDYHQDYLVKKPEGYTCHFLRPESVLGD